MIVAIFITLFVALLLIILWMAIVFLAKQKDRQQGTDDIRMGCLLIVFIILILILNWRVFTNGFTKDTIEVFETPLPGEQGEEIEEVPIITPSTPDELEELLDDDI